MGGVSLRVYANAISDKRIEADATHCRVTHNRYNLLGSLVGLHNEFQQTHTNTYEHIQTHTNTYKHTQTHTNTYKHTQTNTQTHTNRHTNTQKLI